MSLIGPFPIMRQAIGRRGGVAVEFSKGREPVSLLVLATIHGIFRIQGDIPFPAVPDAVAVRVLLERMG